MGVAAVLVLLGAGVLRAADPSSLIRRGQYEAAIGELEEIVRADPARHDARRLWAKSLQALGRYEAALEVLEDETGPLAAPGPGLLTARGRILVRIGRLDEAEATFRAALEEEPDDVEVLNRLGGVLYATGRKDEAERLWKDVVDVYRDLSYEEAEKLPAASFVEMGLALVGLNRFQDAHDVMFSQAEEIDPKDPDLLLEWGRVLLEKYNFPQSRETLREALEENPRFADARVALAENYLVDFQVGTKRYELAEKQIEKALEVNPRHAGALAARGSLWLSDGNLETAADDFRRALEVNPSDLRVLGLLSACHHLSADENAFGELERKALSINPICAEFYHTIAKAIETRFRYEDAVRMGRRAVELDPDYWPAFHTIAINLLRTGEEKEGRDFLDKAWEADRFNVWVLNTRKLLRHIDENHRELKTEHFVFRFPKDDYDVLRALLAPLLEKAYDRLTKHYRQELEPPIRIDVFSNHQWFSARIVGLGGFPATGACFGNVVALTTPKAVPQNWGAVAWHEFAHVVTLHATKHRVPRWLTEGLSVFEEGRDHPQWARGFERQVADHYASGRLLPLGELDFGFSKPKYPEQILMSYFQGCLVVEHIRKEWSFEKILEILDGYRRNRATAEIFRDVLGMSLEEFDKGFFAFVDRWVAANGYAPRLFPDVIPKLELACEEHPEDARRLSELAWAYYTSGNDIDAPLTAKKALKLDPAAGDAHAVLGFSELAEKKDVSARASLERALESGTRFRFRVHVALGELDLKDGKKAEAASRFEEAKRISPRAGAGYPPGRNLYYRLATLYNEIGEEELAVERMEELRRFAVEDGRCRQALLRHYLAQSGREADGRALEVLEELLYLNPFNRKLHEEMARLAIRLEDHETVVREVPYLLKFPGTDLKSSYLALAGSLRALGRSEEARTYARKLLELDPGNQEAREILEAGE